jgi:hypothetical protein
MSFIPTELLAELSDHRQAILAGNPPAHKELAESINKYREYRKTLAGASAQKAAAKPVAKAAAELPASLQSLLGGIKL